MGRSLWILFGTSGRIGRLPFAIGLVASVALFWLGVRGSLAALPWMAEVLAPHGINAGFALNAIWLTLGMLLVWALIALGAKRLRDRNRSPWWIVVVVLPLAALVLANDAIFLVSRSFSVPKWLQWVLLADSGLIGLWVLLEGLLGPSRQPTITLEPPPEPGRKGLRERLERSAEAAAAPAPRNPNGSSD